MRYVDKAALKGTNVPPRELRCLALAARGLSVSQIASETFTTTNTVNTNLARARARLGALNTTHAVAILVRRGVITKIEQSGQDV